MSVLIADVVRRELGVGRYKPTVGEIERYKEEIPLYKRAQHLQYLPTPQEIETIVKNCPVCINGEGTEDEEVTGYRDLPRIETNRLRGGACLVIAEGLCLKAPKILKHVSKLKIKEWDFLETFIKKGSKEDTHNTVILPSSKYLDEVIAGRPVISHPSKKGGFRLRYGRSRTCGLASTAINPATMYLLDEFITVGTQMKTEKPGKGTIGTPCDQIEGPIVLLKNKDVVQVNPIEEAIEVRDKVEKIIDIGEILIPFGEFIENNAALLKSSYVYEWWFQELQEKLNTLPKELTKQSILEADNTTSEIVERDFNKSINLQKPSPFEAFEISNRYNVPLHPYYNLFWHDITKDDLIKLANYVREKGKIICEEDKVILKLPKNSEIKGILIALGVLHKERESNFIIERFAYPIIKCCGLDVDKNNNIIIETDRYKLVKERKISDDVISSVSNLSGVVIREKAPSRIGARMGRPEKASPRKMRPPPSVLFPLGNYGGNQRLIKNAAEKGKIEVEAGARQCPKCNRITFRTFCDCGEHTIQQRDKVILHEINMAEELNRAQKNLEEDALPETIKGVIGTISRYKTPEPLEKGILRAKHGVFVFKDGTVRFDMTNAPLTHFKPKEIGTSVEKLKELGYTKDYNDKPLENENQICELKPQDVIISKECARYFVRISKFIDDLLTKFYKMKPFYNVNSIEDLIGHIVVGLAPHTSAGVAARIIGFTDAQVCFAHPFYHAAKRRNADGDEDGLMLLMDTLLNFSHAYIPDKRGGQMDLPLILTTRIDPAEVDKEAQNIDLLPRYPLDFYIATTRNEHPKNLEKIMDLVSSRLGTPFQYENFGFTHDTSDISAGPPASAYKTLKTMMDKMNAQLRLAAKIEAVDEADVACKVIERHFLPDILGNLRAFSKQSVRCPLCNTVYRRIPLKGICTKCGGNLTLTVHERSIKKYLEISKMLTEKYNLPDYACQRIRLVEKSIESLFTNDKVKMTKLSDFL
jgi:DNA polymerase II large subunit